MKELLIALGVIEALGILSAVIMIIPICIHAEFEQWQTVKEIRGAQLGALIAPISLLYLMGKTVIHIVKVYRHPME